MVLLEVFRTASGAPGPAEYVYDRQDQHIIIFKSLNTFQNETADASLAVSRKPLEVRSCDDATPVSMA